MPDDLPRYLALKAVMMPRDTNPYGTIFGGVLLSYIDQAGAVGAKHVIAQNGWPCHALVTVGMQSVAFHEAVLVGDVVSFWTQAVRVGTTSITMHVDVETERQRQTIKLTEAEVTYVSVELTARDRRPVPIRGRVGRVAGRVAGAEAKRKPAEAKRKPQPGR